MKNLWELAETFSDFVCTFDVEHCSMNRNSIICGNCEFVPSCSDLNLSSYEMSCHEATKYDIYRIRKKFEHEIEQMLGSTSEQAFQVFYNLCNFSDNSEKEFSDRRQKSTSLHKRTHFCKKRYRNSPRNIGALLLDTRSFDDLSVELSDDYSSRTHAPIDALYYDSDPEEYCIDQIAPKSPLPSYISNHHSSLKPEAQCSQYTSYMQEDKFVVCNSHCEEDDFQNSLLNASDCANDNDHFIRALFNESIMLVYHSSQTENKIIVSPMCVTVWFEMGSCFKNKVIPPKLMWKKSFNQSRKRYFSSCQQPDSIDLLSITRVLKPQYINRQKHPFIKLKNSFILHCADTSEVYLFEAHCEQECNRLIYGLKSVIAKIASKIIVGDDDVYAEYFTPWDKTMNLAEI